MHHCDITVLIATHNRAAMLTNTLSAMMQVNRAALAVEWVIADNNSTDTTRRVIREFEKQMPLRYVFESRAGKNCALNRALSEAELGKIVVFTDDDVVPDPEWLQAIAGAVKRHPSVDVFGGRIDPMWPGHSIPSWAMSRMALDIGFCAHDHGDRDLLYPAGTYPFGANLWLRRSVFEDGRRYNERIGPRPTNRIMGSETSLLQQLESEGYVMMYVPSARVGHRIQPCEMSVKALLRRAYRHGRSRPYLRGLPHADLLRRHPLLWRVRRVGGVCKYIVGCVTALACSSSVERIDTTMRSVAGFASNIESLRIARELSARG